MSIAINVAHISETGFSSAEIALTYDSTKLQYISVSSGSVSTSTANTVKLADYGSYKNMGNAYLINFTAISQGSTSVTLSSAAFGTSASAAEMTFPRRQLSHRQ
ncbi:MAG: hypothetical protein GX633_01935 [Clostridiales bacterium]|nr:hypothetical protein [Clostridiales bacterium]